MRKVLLRWLVLLLLIMPLTTLFVGCNLFHTGTRVPAFMGKGTTSKTVGSKVLTEDVATAMLAGRVPIITGWTTSTDVVNNQVTQPTVFGNVVTTIADDTTADQTTYSGNFDNDTTNTYTAVVHNANNTFDYTQDVSLALINNDGPGINTPMVSHTEIINAVMDVNGDGGYTANGKSWSIDELNNGTSYFYYDFQVKITPSWEGIYMVNPLYGSISSILYDPSNLAPFIANYSAYATGPDNIGGTGSLLYYGTPYGDGLWAILQARGTDADTIWNANQ